MFAKKPSSNKIAVEDAIYSLLEEMANLNGDSDAYARMADQVEKLYKLREVDAKVDAQKRVSPDTWAVVGANLVGILMIVGHERANVVTSKALNLLMKLG